MIAAALRTHCPHGHLYDEANTIIKKRGAGRAPSRDCRTCTNDRARRNAKRPIVIGEHEVAALLERLLSQIKVSESGCWEWIGGRFANGYARIRWHGKTVQVHRIVAHLVHGLDINDPDVVARHHCDNPPCINPEHLAPGTHADNVQDAIARGRSPHQLPRKTCAQGHALTADNLPMRADGRRGWCRQCNNAWQRARRRRLLRGPQSPVGSGPVPAAPDGSSPGTGREGEATPFGPGFQDPATDEMPLALTGTDAR